MDGSTDGPLLLLLRRLYCRFSRCSNWQLLGWVIYTRASRNLVHIFLRNSEDAIAQKSGSEFIVRRAGAAAHASETSAKKGGEGIAHSVVKCEIDPPLVSFAFHRADIVIVTSFNSDEDIKLSNLCL